MDKKTNKTQTVSSIDQKELVNLVYVTATSTYGVSGIAKKDINQDKISLVTPNTAAKGIIVRKYITYFDISVYLVLAKDVKVTEALRECKKAVKYVVNKKYPKMCRKINIYAVGIN